MKRIPGKELGRLRRSEWVLIAYFAYTCVLAAVLPLRWPIPAVAIGASLAIFAGLVILAWSEPLRRWEPLRVLRDWFPLIALLLAYQQMGWFAPASHKYEFERVWVTWDRYLLYNLHLKPIIEAGGSALPSVLEIAYSLVYTIPTFSLAMLYAYRCREHVEPFLLVFVTGVLAAYVLFPYFPSEPPRTVFPGQDFPSVDTVFRRFNWWLLSGYGIHTSVFPSAHVSGAFSGAFAMLRLMRKRRWVGRYLVTLATLIATATVYGRYHYAADAIAGFAIAVAAQAVGIMFERRDSRLRV